eukprot:6205808-Pleurochrysis_carterae.AAC.4
MVRAMIRASSCVQAVNFLVNETFCHHPVMLEVDTQYRVLEPDYLLEWNGLKVPAAFDCDIFNNGRHWGNHFYFYEVPSRWSMCWSHYAAMKSGMRLERPELPIVDDEYSEQVAVYHSVLRASATQPFVMAELGARWGTWGSRAIAFLKQRRPELSYKLELVEAFPNNCRGVEQAYLRGRYRQHPPTGASLDEIVRKGCYHMTPRGPVAHWDGELIVDNPKFVHPRELLSMNDTVLMVGSLLLGRVLKLSLAVLLVLEMLYAGYSFGCSTKACLIAERADRYSGGVHTTSLPICSAEDVA